VKSGGCPSGGARLAKTRDWTRQNLEENRKETKTMKTFALVLGAVTLAIVLVAAGVWLGLTLSQGRWGYGMMGPAAMMGTGMMSGGWAGMPCDEGWQGSGMMGRGWEDMPYGKTFVAPGDGEVTSLKEVETIVDRYVDRVGYTGLKTMEVMEFERNYYAIVAEEDTAIGAMELLIDKADGAVGPEPGPNMMWNAKYGMMGQGGMMGMVGSYAGTDEMTLSPEEAQDVAQRWLDANLPGRTAGEADPFYGYYTLHFLQDGEIEGMLSVHGSTGDIWYHSWHGDFIAMAEGHS
jgi:hypothetical protein